MFGKAYIVRLAGSFALASVIAVLGARTAKAQTFITDTLGGNGHPTVYSVQLITDTLGGNGHAYSRGAYVYGGASQQVGQAIQSLGKAPSPAPAVELSPSGNGFDWSNVEIGAGSAAFLMLLLSSGVAVRTSRRRVAAA